MILGKGLIILLHGAPGVGKTSTAGQFRLTRKIRFRQNLNADGASIRGHS